MDAIMQKMRLNFKLNGVKKIVNKQPRQCFINLLDNNISFRFYAR